MIREMAFPRQVKNAKIPQNTLLWGTVKHVASQAIQIDGLTHKLGLGDYIEVPQNNGNSILGEIIALNHQTCIAMMYGDPLHINIGDRAYYKRANALRPSKDWIGKILNYEGKSANGERPRQGDTQISLQNSPPPAIKRKHLGLRIDTGVAALDTFLPLCTGQRVGLFAGSGVGKSTLLATLAQSAQADICIIALIGERGREVRSFVEKTLGEKAIKRSIVFVSTSDDPSAIKLRTALLAMATAEYFRNQGQSVLLLFDSLTRIAEAHRDIALSAGEIPSLRAYPPSTFRTLAKLCERAGPGTDIQGDITAVFSVLVAGSNMEEPIADMVRGILDGHIVLEREIAERGRYPAINIGKSISRSLPEAANCLENDTLRKAKALITTYETSRPLIQAGLYTHGADPHLDEAIKRHEALEGFMSQTGLSGAKSAFEDLDSIISDSNSADKALQSNLTGQEQIGNSSTADTAAK